MASKVRDKIVSAATDCFHSLGFSACGVQEIVDRAGVPKGSFYNYFKAKELLAIEVLETYAKGSKREMLADTRRPPLERLKAHFEFLASRYKGYGYAKGCLIGNLAAEASDNMPLMRKALAQSLSRWTEAVTAVIREGQADESIAADLEPKKAARFLINSWEGAVVRMKIVNGREPLDDFFSVAFLPLAPAPNQRPRKSTRNRAASAPRRKAR